MAGNAFPGGEPIVRSGVGQKHPFARFPDVVHHRPAQADARIGKGWLGHPGFEIAGIEVREEGTAVVRGRGLHQQFEHPAEQGVHVQDLIDGVRDFVKHSEMGRANHRCVGWYRLHERRIHLFRPGEDLRIVRQR